uniref:Phosphatidic acid phosphatase type 2/haloperoxidase domain-containing protein n=2 Tax=Meloidogyne TaxID=189290 RepID=A0A915MCD1_MELJA
MPSPQWSEQFGSVSHLGVNSESATTNKFQINYFLLPNFIIHIVGLAALWALWYYLRLTNVFPFSLLLTGYQRPYFLSLCNVSLASCTAPLEHSPSPSPHLACNYRNADELRYAWLTFPSLHAAFSSYSACFASCYIYYMINLRGAPLLRPMLIFGLFGMALVDSFSRINGYKNHWRDIWVGWIIGFVIAIFLCNCVLRFQEIYYTFYRSQTQPPPPPPEPEAPPPPFFSWFRLPRVRAPSVKEEYVVYEEDVPTAPTISPPTAGTSHRKNRDRTYEVTTTTESFHRTIVPPGTSQQQRNNKNGANNNGGNGSGGGGGYAAPY